MSLRQNRNITTTLVGKASPLTSALPAVGNVITPTNIVEGALVLVDLANRRISTAPAGTDFRIAQGQGVNKPLLLTPIMNQARISKTVGAHRAAKQQITIVGYNPATGVGSLPVANDTSYFIKIRKNDNDAANRSQPNSLFAQFKTDANGTQKELAFGLAKNGEVNFKDEPANGYLKFEVLCDEAGAATGAAADTVTGNKGSRDLLFTDTAANSSVIALSVGDLIRLGTTTSDETFLVTASTVAVTGGIATLDRPLKADVSLLGTTVEYITSAAASAAEFGVRLTGVKGNFDVARFRNYYAHRFTATFSDTTTPVNHIQGAFDGVGVYEKVAMDEYMTYGFEGMNDMLGVPPSARYASTQSAPLIGTIDTNKYSAYQIEFSEPIGHLVSNDIAKGSVIIYLNLNNDFAGIVPTTSAEAALIAALGGTRTHFTEIV